MDIEELGLKKMTGYDSCIVGVAYRFGETFIVYDHERVIKQLMEQDGGMSYVDAVEFHDFNQAGAYVGVTTPAFLHKLNDDDLRGRNRANIKQGSIKQSYGENN